MRKMEQKNRILIVEDDTDINNLLYTALQKAGYETVQAFSGTEARMLFQMDKAGFSLILLDLMLPGISGEEVLAQIRKQGNTPVIVLTAKDGLDEKIGLLTSGADDYITKPFSLSVLLLKIEAYFRRRQEKTEAGKMISGDIVFIAGEMKVLIKSREISLTKTELKMLTFFLQNPKQILSKTQILENVFDLEGDFVDENTIAVNIRRLREKIEDNPAAPVYIKNIRGLGYIWNQEVRQ